MTLEFKRWLAERGMSISAFASATGISHNTIARWSSEPNRKPRMAYKILIKQKFPDCPLAKDQ